MVGAEGFRIDGGIEMAAFKGGQGAKGRPLFCLFVAACCGCHNTVARQKSNGPSAQGARCPNAQGPKCPSAQVGHWASHTHRKNRSGGGRLVETRASTHHSIILRQPPSTSHQLRPNLVVFLPCRVPLGAVLSRPWRESVSKSVVATVQNWTIHRHQHHPSCGGCGRCCCPCCGCC